MPGTSLLRRFNEAADMSAKQKTIFDQLSATFAPEIVNKWEVMVINWNADPKALNPYREPASRKFYFFLLRQQLLSNSYFL